MEGIPPNPEDGERFLPADLFLEINNASPGGMVTVNKIHSRPRRVYSSTSTPKVVPLLGTPVTNFKAPTQVYDYNLVYARPNVKPTIGNVLPTVDYCFYCPPFSSAHPFVSRPQLTCYPVTPALQNKGFRVFVTANPQGTGVFLPADPGKEHRPNKGNGGTGEDVVYQFAAIHKKGGKKDAIEIYGNKRNVVEGNNVKMEEEAGHLIDQK